MSSADPSPSRLPSLTKVGQAGCFHRALCYLRRTASVLSLSLPHSSSEKAMAFPSASANDDPDPTTQMAWPTRRPSNEPMSPVDEYRSPLLPQQDLLANGQDARPDNKKTVPPDADLEEIGKRRLTTRDLFNLTVSMAGAQIAWTVELGCALSASCSMITPFNFP